MFMVVNHTVMAFFLGFGTMRLRDGREVWAYEVDGFGNALFMDDANVPSLSGLAYLGCVDPADPLWQRTRDACWSDTNPWFFSGKAGEGIGGPHVGEGQIWPMSLTIRALSASGSSTDDATIRATAGWDVVSCELDYVGSYGAPPSAATPLRATWRLVPAPPAPASPKKKG